MAAATVQSSTNLFRRLAWNATVPLEIRIADGEPGAGGAVDRYYVQAPRYTYLALLLQEIRQNLVELAVDDEHLAKTDEANWWFEEDAGDEEGSSARFASQGQCKWHWPIDLIELHSAIASPATREHDTPALPAPSTTPLKLILHLSVAPADKQPIGSTVEAAKTQFVSQVKEADFVRWGNTKRVTSLRRGDLEAGWDGVSTRDFDLHARMAGRLVPLPIPLPPGTTSPPVSGFGGTANSSGGTPAALSRPPSTEPGQSREPKLESAYAARSLPIRLYLPDNAPAMQYVVAPLQSDGRPTTLLQLLRTHLPLLFPSVADPYLLAQPLAQGIVLPSDAEVAWLAACMAGADGWLRIGIRLVAQ